MNTLYSRRIKRPLDAVISGVALIALAPLFTVAGAAIRIDTPGPALFAQSRVGKNGVVFEVLKFRSMLSPSESVRPDGSEMSNSERVTRVGRILRRVSLDELPQLVNVLRGDMSLVGPRPALPYQVSRYSTIQRERLSVRPGITGLAQVSGRNKLTWDEKIALDLEYCREVRMLDDLRILLRTARAVVSRDGQDFVAHDAISSHGDVSYLKHI
ncbi:Sugar transferase involved in LPS biosynthesis (colanic, teichoic acid) [Agrococcus baldri]|uniref:Sugar transferase involved in LPS biosynthesis (Colanic, teichoic acid) n=1 Tax=Agrococcus baldri TaxID=153730 RepID=A0AA94HKU0_9MICO|nr:sugar transferase [Agrococcus baldri]SFS00263.1 Sugar transferase involved in LPS biosynthesis (colanic, teichoic acid) [Agrococcus baldri]